MEDIPHKFWKKYFKSDELDKDKILKPLLKVLDVSAIKDKNTRKHILILSLKSYLMDIENYYETLMEEQKRGDK